MKVGLLFLQEGFAQATRKRFNRHGNLFGFPWSISGELSRLRGLVHSLHVVVREGLELLLPMSFVCNSCMSCKRVAYCALN